MRDSYTRGRMTGHNDGTLGGMLGARDHANAGRDPVFDHWADVAKKKDQARKEAAERARRASQDDSSKVICTELHRQGLMSRADYALGADYARTYLTDRHYRGYHAWALPVVRQMRRSKRATAFWRTLAQARADHIAYLNGDATRRSRFGALLCAIGYPLCYLIGGMAAQRDWRSLYDKQARKIIS